MVKLIFLVEFVRRTNQIQNHDELEEAKMTRSFKKMLMVAILGSAIAINNGRAEVAKEFVICKFQSQTNLKPWQAGASSVVLTVEPRSPQEVDYKLKVVNGVGEYAGIELPNPPSDWSSYEVFSFEVWSPVTTSMEIRIDDAKSQGYATRLNYSFRVTNGRNLIQIPIEKIRRAVDVRQIKLVKIFMGGSTPSLTLYYDQFRLGSVQTETVAFIPYNERNDTQPTTDVRTPHFEFGRNLSGGPIRTFAIASIQQGRDVAELMQRLDTQMSVVTWEREGDVNAWGLGNSYSERGAPDDQSILQRYLASSIQGPEKFETMILTTPMGWSKFPQGVRERIISRVEQEGVGLILIMPFPGGDNAPGEWTDELWKVCALIDSPSDYLGADHVYMRVAKSGVIPSKKWRSVGEHPITSGIPLDAMPTGRSSAQIMDYKPAPGAQVLIETEDGRPVMAVKQLGKGRVVTFAFRSRGLTPSLAVNSDDGMKTYPYRYWEVWYDLLARSVYWASGRTFARSGEAIPLVVQGADADSSLKAKQWKDSSGKITDWQIDFTPPPVIDVVRLTVPEMLDHGKDMQIRVPLWQIKDYQKAKWHLTAAEPSSIGERIMEEFDLDLAGVNAPMKDQQSMVTLSSGRFSSTAALIHLTGSLNGKLVAEGRATILFTPNQTWDDFEIHCWGGAEGLPFLTTFERSLEKQLGVTCQQTSQPAQMYAALESGFRNQYYAGINGLHIDLAGVVQEYNLTRNPSLLVRRPSLVDPEEIAKRHKEVLDKVSKLNKFKPLSGIIADETSLTSYIDDFDFDFYPANIATFREKLEARYKAVGAMNQALKMSASSFASIVPPTTAEAKASGNWGLWNEWRAHNDDMWTRAMTEYADWFNEACPGMRFSISGTQASAPFNGIDWAKLTKAFRSVVGYRGRYQDLQRASFHPTGDLKSLSWVGYTGKGLAAHHQMWGNLLTGDSGCGVFWWLSMRNPDLTWSQSAKDYKAVFDVFRRGLGRQYQLTKRNFSPVAVLWSANSQRAAYAVGKFTDFVAAEKEVVESLRNAGFDPYFISEEQILTGDLQTKGTKALFLPMTLSLGRGEQPAGIKVWPKIKEFLDQKGLVVTTAAPECDEFLQPLTPPNQFSELTVPLASIKDDLQGALAKRGVNPTVIVKNKDGLPLEALRTYVHELPAGDKKQGYIVSLLLPPPNSKQTIGADGVPRIEASADAGKPVPCVVDCSALKYVAAYEPSSGQRITTGPIFQVAVTAAEGKLITLLPYVVKNISAQVTESDRNLSVSWQINREVTSGGVAELFVPHVVRIDIVAAETGVVNLDLSRNLTSDAKGQGTVKIPLSISEGGAKWNVVVRDILTGKNVTAFYK